MISEPRLLSPVRGSFPPEELHGLRVLIVDDNRDGANSLSDLLAIRGAEAHVRYNGADAIVAAAALRPDIAILDVTMPKMDGCEAAARILLGVNPPPFLIALTGRLDDCTRERVAQCGFDLHFAKPMEPGDLLCALNAIMRVRTAREARA